MYNQWIDLVISFNTLQYGNVFYVLIGAFYQSIRYMMYNQSIDFVFCVTVQSSFWTEWP